MTGFLVTIFVLALIYCAVGIGAEFFNTGMEDDPFRLNRKSLLRIIKWPKYIFF